jgi:hypothetical protein
VLPNYFANVMACAEQYAFCNPTTSNCAAPAGLFRTFASVNNNNKLGLNAAQQATAIRLGNALPASDTFNTVAGLGPDSLWANSLVFERISPSLPSNQWQVEVEGWFQTTLAKLQGYVVEYASNAADLGRYGQVTSPYNKYSSNGTETALWAVLADQCANQLVRTAGEVQNFSFLGTMLIVCLSVFLVLLDLTIQSLVETGFRAVGKKSTANNSRVARQADEKLHLLRMALGGGPQGDTIIWEKGKLDIPILSSKEAAGMKFERPVITDESSQLASYSGSTTVGVVEDSNGNQDANTNGNDKVVTPVATETGRV